MGGEVSGKVVTGPKVREVVIRNVHRVGFTSGRVGEKATWFVRPMLWSCLLLLCC